jgi:hypothetical protein
MTWPIASAMKATQQTPLVWKYATAIQLAVLSEQYEFVCNWGIAPTVSGDLGRKGAPFLQRGRASLLVKFATDEMALLIEVVVDLGVD